MPGPPDGHPAPAADLDVAGPQVDQHGGVLVHAEHGGIGGQAAFHHGQPAFAEVAVPGVVAAAFGVVVVRDERDGEAERAEQVEPVQPARRAARLVDLVDRQGEPSRGGGGRRGQHGQPVAGQHPVPQPGRDRSGLPVRERVRRAPGPGEHPVRRPDAGCLARLVLLVRRDQRRRHGRVRVRAGAGRDPHLQADAVREVALRPRRDVRGVLLERVRSGEHDRLRAGQPEPRYELPVHRDHGRAGLAGPDDRQHTYRSHRRRDLLCRFLSPGRTIHYVATLMPVHPAAQVRRVSILLPGRAASSRLCSGYLRSEPCGTRFADQFAR